MRKVQGHTVEETGKEDDLSPIGQETLEGRGLDCAADLEERERRGYEIRPQRLEEYLPWEGAAVWPEG